MSNEILLNVLISQMLKTEVYQKRPALDGLELLFASLCMPMGIDLYCPTDDKTMQSSRLRLKHSLRNLPGLARVRSDAGKIDEVVARLDIKSWSDRLFDVAADMMVVYFKDIEHLCDILVITKPVHRLEVKALVDSHVTRKINNGCTCFACSAIRKNFKPAAPVNIHNN